ncbi:MAG: DNA polymerase I [Flavobacteriales bacterium]
MITPQSDKKLFLLDAYALIFRAYYAFIKNPRINSKGWNTSAIFGFTNAVLDVLRNEKPTHLAVVIDPPGGTFRNEVFPEYKANRDETPEDIKRAVPWVSKVLEALDVPLLSLAGFEADDLIGCLAKQAGEQGFDVYMMTPDKDFGQLVTDTVRMFRPGRGGGPAEVWGPEEVCEKFGVDRPEQVIDLLGLMGDSVDNIPGIPGVGPKTASKFIKQYGSLEGLLENASDLKGKMREKVEANVEQAKLSKDLATIRVDMDFALDIDAMKTGEPKPDLLREVFEELEFRTLALRVLGEAPAAPVGTKAPSASGQLGMFDAPSSESKTETQNPADGFKDIANVPHQYHLVLTWADLKKLISTLSEADTYAWDTETTGLNVMTAELVGMSFCIDPGEAWWVPVQHGEWTHADELLAAFSTIFEDTKKSVVAHNFKYDYKILARRGVRIANRICDTMVAHYLIQPDGAHGLNRLAETELDYAPIAIETLIGKKGKSQKTMADLDPASITDYACEDADLALQLWQRFEPMLQEHNAKQLFDNVEMPLVRILAEMELEGVRIDAEHLRTYSAQLEVQIQALNQQIQTLAGTAFNVDSPRQLGPILFEGLEIPSGRLKKTKTGQYPTGEEVLTKLKDHHPIISKILDYRKLKKLRSTYVEPLPTLIHNETGRVHTHYMQTVAATGRLSSKDPNLQNIPIRTPEGREIRKAFVPGDKDRVLLAADYSQVELRIAAALSQDPGLIEAFVSGEDIHAATAAKVFGVALEEVTREQRSQAKAVNFGILYGQGAFGLANTLGISRREAKSIIDAYFAQFSALQSFTADAVERVRETGYAETVLGRRRLLPDIHSNNATVRAFAERNAVNAPIQGSAADIIKVAMVQIDEALKASHLKSRMIMQVHDELVFDVPREEVHQLMPLIQKHMEEAVRLDVPLVVEMSTGEDWLEAH